MQVIKEKLSTQDHKDIANLFNLTGQELTELDGYESYVLAAAKSILKINLAETRSKDEHLAELNFINHLAEGGASVAKALSSNNNQIVESFKNKNSSFFVSQFVKAEGESPQQEDASPELFMNMGRTMGKLHHLSKTYKPNDNQKRNEWFEDSHIRNLEANLKPDDPARPYIIKLYEQLKTLATSEDAYGLIHADFHSDNLMLEADKLTVIDFGDCMYSWFALDIATALFYHKRFLKDADDASEEDQETHLKTFYEYFVQGYQQENTLEQDWLELIPLFMQWRYADLYLYLADLQKSAPLDKDEQEAVEMFSTILQEDKRVVLS